MDIGLHDIGQKLNVFRFRDAICTKNECNSFYEMQ